jgi:hypothetical protein
LIIGAAREFWQLHEMRPDRLLEQTIDAFVRKFKPIRADVVALRELA